MNYFQCQIWKLNNKSIYPGSILPKVNYRRQINIDSLIQNQQLYALRRSHKPFDETFNKLGDYITLREDAIEPLDVINMSLDLLGGKFISRYLNFKPLIGTTAVKEWDGYTQVYLYENLNNYEIVDVPCIIYFNVNKIHNRDLPYKRGLDGPYKKFLDSCNKEYDKKAKEYEAVGKTQIKHDPTNLNYWHIELTIYQHEMKSEEVPRKSSEWVKKIGRQAIKDILTTNVFDRLPIDIPRISKSWFVKSMTPSSTL